MIKFDWFLAYSKYKLKPIIYLCCGYIRNTENEKCNLKSKFKLKNKSYLGRKKKLKIKENKSVINLKGYDIMLVWYPTEILIMTISLVNVKKKK